jgi:hypothetical protein
MCKVKIRPHLLPCDQILEFASAGHAQCSTHLYQVRPRNDTRGVDLISDALPFGRLWYEGPEAAANATGYAKFYSRSHHAVIRVYDEAGNLIEAHKHAGDFRES